MRYFVVRNTSSIGFAVTGGKVFGLFSVIIIRVPDGLHPGEIPVLGGVLDSVYTYVPGMIIVLEAGSEKDRFHPPHVEGTPAERVRGLHSLER